MKRAIYPFKIAHRTAARKEVTQLADGLRRGDYENYEEFIWVESSEGPGTCRITDVLGVLASGY